jgi:hypothetical protein
VVVLEGKAWLGGGGGYHRLNDCRLGNQVEDM